jgi:hypothetical protein
MGAIERWARDRGAVWVMLDTYAASPLSVPRTSHSRVACSPSSSLNRRWVRATTPRWVEQLG